MKKSYTLLAAALLCGSLSSSAYNIVSTTSHPEQDVKRFQTADWINNGSTEFQEIKTYFPKYLLFGPEVDIYRFEPEFIITQKDFQGTEGNGLLPTNAKITRMILDGYYNTDHAKPKLKIKTYIRNTESAELEDRNGGYEADPLPTDACYNETSVVCRPEDSATSADAIGKFVDVPFSTPFEYEGNNVLLNLDIEIVNDGTHFYYKATKGETKYASTYRTGNHAYNASVSGFGDVLGISDYSLPAFGLDYYTNDIRGTLKDGDGVNRPDGVVLQLIDKATGNVEATRKLKDGAFKFINVDYSKDYSLVVDNGTYTTDVDFGEEPIKNDVQIDIVDNDVITGVENVNVATVNAYGVEGGIRVVADKAQKVNVYDLTGRVVRTANVEAGETVIDGLSNGVYIVNHIKVVVK